MLRHNKPNTRLARQISNKEQRVIIAVTIPKHWKSMSVQEAFAGLRCENNQRQDNDIVSSEDPHCPIVSLHAHHES
jgi:hypothetical protein